MYMTMIIYSNYYNKSIPEISELEIDFTLVRNLVYKFSKKALEKFFEVPTFAFLFIYFTMTLKEGGFLKKKLVLRKNEEFILKMMKTI